MLTPARKLLLVIAMITATGGQWGILQSAAWALMLVDHLRVQSMPEAIAQTFDGNHPCPICKAISQAKKSEKKSEFVGKIARLEFPPLEHDDTLIAPDLFRLCFQVPDQLTSTGAVKPAIPPPRPLSA
jgi:hypothetical protein